MWTMSSWSPARIVVVALIVVAILFLIGLALARMTLGL
jgi:hypothetical protein